jgi:hypothetical protein
MNDAELRFALRQLPRERTPPADGWPAIAAAVAEDIATGTPRDAARAAATPAPRRRGAGAWLGAALAASLLLAVFAARDPRPDPAADDARPSGAVALAGEAARLRAEYLDALALIGAPPAQAELAPVIASLERDAADVEDALRQQPDAAWLLEQQRRVYTRHLALARLLATG